MATKSAIIATIIAGEGRCFHRRDIYGSFHQFP
jgi:hypothetical protein